MNKNIYKNKSHVDRDIALARFILVMPISRKRTKREKENHVEATGDNCTCMSSVEINLILYVKTKIFKHQKFT